MQRLLICAPRAARRPAGFPLTACACCASYSSPPPHRQITHFKGQRVAADIGVWNPSFDGTPAELIEGIITERVGGP